MATTDPLVFNDNGTIDITFDSATRVHLKCPRLRDYRLLRNDINERLAGILEQRKKVITGEASTDEQSDFLASHDVMVTGWIELVLDTMVPDAPVPDVDEWPAWLSNSKLPTKFMTHWQNAPFVSGN